MSVKVEVENQKLYHIILDEDSTRNLLTLLWDCEDFAGQTLYREIVNHTFLERKISEEITIQSGEFTFYKILG